MMAVFATAKEMICVVMESQWQLVVVSIEALTFSLRPGELLRLRPSSNFVPQASKIPPALHLLPSSLNRQHSTASQASNTISLMLTPCKMALLSILDIYWHRLN